MSGINTLLVGSVPAICMLVCTILGLGIKVPENIAGAFQHFAAGLLLAAVGCELLPTLVEASGFRENLFATVGFFAGMGVLIVLGVLLPEDHDDGDDHDDHDHRHERNSSIVQRRSSTISESFRDIATGQRRLRSSTTSRHDTAKAIHEAYCNACGTIEEGGHSHEGQPLVATGSKAIAPAAIVPLSFVAAIVVDAFMDGFLIGITGVAGKGAATMMAGCLSIEMSFVGLTLATACHGMPWSRSIPLALAGPLTLVFGATVGGILGGAVEGDPALMAGIMGFGTSALLFMVAEELLLEAHENGKHVWWVDVQLYTGFYWGFMSTKFLPS